MAETQAQPLKGAVAVVAGATRGAGRGIARALGEAGALVYCAGRSVKGNPSPYNRPETIEETAAMITEAGGNAIPVRVDHAVEAEVQALMERVANDQGRLDVLVNSAAGEDPMMKQWASLWNTDLANADAILRQGLVSHIITAKHASLLMIPKKSGLIVEVTEGDQLLGGGNVLTRVVKFSQKALAASWAAELRIHRVAAVSVTPGFLRSERMLEHFQVTEENWRDAGAKDKNFLESESPLFVGRGIAALAADPTTIERTGQLFSSWELARQYGFTDADGRRPDWGALEIDYSMFPASFMQEYRDGAEIQAEWLEVLSRRAHKFRDSL